VTVHRDSYRDVIGRFATGVTVITTEVDGRWYGTTASAVTSLSLDPPMLLVCLNKSSETQAAILQSGTFGVNVLGEEQAELARRFAVKSTSKFEGVGIHNGLSGAPLLSGSLAHVECRVADTASGGTHTVFLAAVENVAAREGGPLTYFRGRFGRFDDAGQNEAYQLLRRLVLRRDLPAGSAISTLALAEQHRLDPGLVDVTLARLASERLVFREAPDSFVVAPLTTRFVEEALQVRCAMEIAVADAKVGHLNESEVMRLEAFANAACAAIAKDPVDLRSLTSASAAFHETFIALLDNERFVELYQGLRINTVWNRTLPPGEYIDPSYLRTLAHACAEGDVETAKRAIYEHAAEATAIARTRIERIGGRV
jgi:flavin reductase (DIM6/NTAB) family NADH-FMN oxidoreductase RutF/DNA-binding GntR family transcriptional regulator